MKKRLMAMILSTTMVLGALVGCGTKDEQTVSNLTSGGTGSAVASTGEKFIFFQRKAELNPQFEEIAKIYKEETGVTMEVWGDMGDGYINTLQGKLTSGFGPTIFTVRTGVETELLSSYLTDLSDNPVVPLIINDTALLGANNEVVGIPYGVEGYGFLVSDDIVNADSIKDFASFQTALEKAKTDNKIPFELSEKGFSLIGHMLNIPFAMQKDPLGFLDQLNKGEVKMAETPEFQDWAKYYEAIREYGTNPLEVSYDDQVANFATGESAMITMGNWANVMFDEYDTQVPYEMIPIPVMGNDKLAVGIPNYFAINSQSSAEEQKAASDFLVWLYTSETGKKCMVEKLQLIPTVEGIEAVDLDPMSQKVSDALVSGETLMWTYNYWPNNIVNNFLVPATQEFFLDDSISGQDLLVMLDEAWAQANQEK